MVRGTVLMPTVWKTKKVLVLRERRHAEEAGRPCADFVGARYGNRESRASPRELDRFRA